jgi:MoaA/NifB/PqqE/SkfB family radical SAM enzyme
MQGILHQLNGAPQDRSRTVFRLPDAICFRVTRYCNARCGFCLAPPDGSHPDAATLIHRIDWLMARGVHTIHFCGGEPTIHPAIADLVAYVGERGGKSRLTTNGMVMKEELLTVLRAHRTEVKVSLHGHREQHNQMVGCDAFERTTNTIRRLVNNGVRTSIQTTVVARNEHVVDWVAAFCLEAGIRRLNVLPFIPRGNGYSRRDEFGMTTNAREHLHRVVQQKKKALSERLEVRWLDFTAQPVPVVEADGTLVYEGATEGLDRRICQIPPLESPVFMASSRRPGNER